MTFVPPAGFRDSPSPALDPGEVVASTYAVREEIASTETGSVFEARDMMLDRLVALKIAWRDQGTPSLLPEARRCAAVRDPCAVQVHGMGAHKGCEFVVGERVVGRLLRFEVERALPPDIYLRELRTLVAAVSRAHQAGIAVGDISGATVLVCPDSRMVLGRLSLSQVPAFGPHGQILAPEVVRGEALANDPAAAEAIDLYGLGCIALELASGIAPFANVDPQLERRGHEYEAPPRLADLRPDLPGELSDLVDWLLAKHPAGRPRSVEDVLGQLDAIIERLGMGVRTLRVLIVDDDTARARWLWSVARRAHAAAVVDIAADGTDAAHKLNRDQPDLVFVDAALRGVMNALELCMYARGLPDGHGQMCLIGAVSERDRALLTDAEVIPDDLALASAILDRVRTAVQERSRVQRSRSKVTG
jgi:serine/threonine-protein kinase